MCQKQWLKAAGRQLYWKETPAQVFFVYDIFQNSFVIEQQWSAVDNVLPVK